MPCAVVSLMLYEARFRVLFSTLLDGSQGIDEGLVQQDAPWRGTRRFGAVHLSEDGTMATIGTVLDILEFAHAPDGRLFITSKGRERMRILRVVQDKPAMLCEVELLADEEQAEGEGEDSGDGAAGGEQEATLASLAVEVADLLRNTIRLNVKMKHVVVVSEDQCEPEELADLGPRDLSFFVASFFSDVKPLQQRLLEEGSTLRRLQKEKEVLANSVRYYSAASALKALSGP